MNVKNRLDRLALRHWEAAASGLLSSLSSAKDASVWFIRRLNVEMTADLTVFGDNAVAAAWSRSFVSQLRRVLSAGPDGVNSLRFEDRTDYLAAFLNDLAHNGAWDHWYYREFESLRVLGFSRAAVEVLRREPEHIAGTLVRLEGRGQLITFLRGLSEGDSRAILMTIPQTGNSGGQGRRALLEAVLHAWGRLGDPLANLCPSAAGLYLFACVTVDCGNPPDTGQLSLIIDAVLSLANILRTDPSYVIHPDAEVSSLSERLRGGKWPRNPALASLLANLDQDDPAWLNEVVKVLVPSRGTASRSAANKGDGTFYTPYAGAFLLLPSYLGLALDDAIDGCAGLRRQIFSLCFGGRRFNAAFADPALGMLAGDTPAEISTAETIEETANVSMTGLLRHLVGTGTVPVRWLLAEEVEESGRRAVILLRDIESGFWLWMAPLEESDPDATIRELLEAIVGAFGEAIECLVVRGRLSDRLTDLGSHHLKRLGPLFNLARPYARNGGEEAENVDTIFCRSVDREEDALPKAISTAIRRFLTKSQKPEIELTYFAGSPIKRHYHRYFLTLAAHAVLRSLAWRLPGFQWSSGQFLHDNFLSGEGTLRNSDESLRVLLPASPLRLVIRMTGIHRSVCQLPWAGERRVELTLPSG